MSKAKLLTGDQVFNLINTSAFVTNWKKLALTIPGFTRLQEPEFVITWYSIYKKEYEPLMVISYEKYDTPVAIMCLAIEKSSGTLTHAGDKNAEYHGWLAKPELESKFISESISLVQRHFSLKKWNWGWMPPGFTVNSLNNLKVSNIYVNIEQRPSLIWNLTIPEKLLKIKKSRSVKSKYNRLRKRGNLEFRVISNEMEMAKILAIAQYQNDFRQEAINDILPFRDNPNKIAFNTALLGFPGTIHASGLWLDNKLLAFHFGICDEKRVCLGTSCYDPSESKHSPGLLLMIELADTLVEQGYEIFDLTPGTDSYKSRHANDRQVLYRPSFYFSTKSVISGRIKQFLMDFLKRILPFFKMNIQTVKYWTNSWEETKKKVSKVGLPKIIQRSLKGIFRVRRLSVYHINNSLEYLKKTEKTEVNFQYYKDLMSYRNLEPWLTRRDLLKEALSKFSKGESLISATKNNELCWSCWYSFSQTPLFMRGFSKKIELENEGYILHDFYCTDKASFVQYFENSLISLKGKGIPIYFILDSSFKISKDKIRLWDIRLSKKLIGIQILWIFKFMREQKSF